MLERQLILGTSAQVEHSVINEVFIAMATCCRHGMLS